MSVSGRIALRPAYRVELAGRAEAREPCIELDLTAVVVLEGSCAATVGDERREVHAGGLALVNPGTALGLSPSRGARILVLSLRAATVEAAAARAGLEGRGVAVFRATFAQAATAVELSAHRVALELESELGGREQALDLAVDLLALDLLRSHAAADPTSRFERSRAGLVDRRLRRSVEFMHDNYARDLALGEIAAEAYLSEFHFARLFKRITGQTPHAYLASLRLDHARRLLAETDLSVSEIGERVGYHSASHFGKVFKASTGITPTAFRDALGK